MLDIRGNVFRWRQEWFKEKTYTEQTGVLIYRDRPHETPDDQVKMVDMTDIKCGGGDLAFERYMSLFWEAGNDEDNEDDEDILDEDDEDEEDDEEINYDNETINNYETR